MEKIAYFEDMKNIATAYCDQLAELRSKKDSILEKYGWDSDELGIYYKDLEDLKSKNPYRSGEYKAYRAYRNAIEDCENEIIMDDFLWDEEVDDFAECLKTAGVKSFIYTNQSTAVMRNIHDLAYNGFVFGGLYNRFVPRRTMFDIDKTVLGIRFVRKER